MDDHQDLDISAQLKSLIQPPLLEIAQKIQPTLDIVKSYELVQRRFESVMSPITKEYLATMNSFSEIKKFATPVHHEWSRIASYTPFNGRLIEAVDNWKSELRDFTFILMELGWTPVLDISVSDIKVWVDAYRKQGLDAIKEPLEEFLVNLYDTEVLERMLSEWIENGRLDSRMHLLEPAIKAHIRGDYALSVPVLLAQLDGFVSEVNNHKGHLHSKIYKKYLEHLSEDDGTMVQLVQNFANTYMLAQFQWGDDIPNMSRHAIFHGADIHYDTASNSLKLIVLLDCLHAHLTAAEDVG